MFVCDALRMSPLLTTTIAAVVIFASILDGFVPASSSSLTGATKNSSTFDSHSFSITPRTHSLCCISILWLCYPREKLMALNQKMKFYFHLSFIRFLPPIIVDSQVMSPCRSWVNIWMSCCATAAVCAHQLIILNYHFYTSIYASIHDYCCNGDICKGKC